MEIIDTDIEMNWAMREMEAMSYVKRQGDAFTLTMAGMIEAKRIESCIALQPRVLLLMWHAILINNWEELGNDW